MMANTNKTGNGKNDTEVKNPFIKEKGITDLALVVEGKKLFVSKVLLSIASPVFKKMFLSDFKEIDAKELPLPGKKYKDVLEFLKCIYPNIQEDFSFDTVTLVLPLMHEYNCERQLQKFQKSIVSNIQRDIPNNLDKILECLFQSYLYGLTESYKACLESASKFSLKQIKSSKFHMELPVALKADLYENRLQQFDRW